MAADTYEEPTARILRFLREEFGETFKAYYDGDPDAIPAFNLPAVVVEKQRDTTAQGPTGLSRVDESILIKLIYDKADDWEASDSTVDLTMKKIRQAFEARDAATGKYLPNSIKGALKTRLKMDDAVLQEDMTLELGVVPRVDDLITAEGHLTVNVSYFVQQ